MKRSARGLLLSVALGAVAAPGWAPVLADDLRGALEQATTTTLAGTAQLQVQGDRATVTLRGTPPDALAQWLAQVRINARLLPLETQLTRDPATSGWNGTVVLSGPGLAGGN